MITGISTASMFGAGLLEENLQELGAHGVHHAEVFLNTFSEYDKSYAKKLRQIADDYGMFIHSVHPHGVQFEPQMFYGYERTALDAFRAFERVLAAAEILGAGVYVFHGGMFYKPAMHHHYHFERIGHVLEKAINLASQYGVRIAYENVHWCWFDSPEFGQQLVEHVHNQQLAFTLDVKQAMQSGVDPLAYLEIMKGRLANVHICDFVRTGDGSLHTCLPFQGEMDFAALRKALFAAKYQGPVMLEVYRQDYEGTSQLFSCYQKVEEFFTHPPADIS